MSLTNLKVEDPKNQAFVQNSPDWRQAVLDLIASWISLGRCFSSGEVAAALRIHRPDLKFRVGGIGEMLRDLFHGQQMANYPDDGTGQPSYPFQGLRIAQGLYPERTPAGTEVFVYGPNQGDIDAHEFEVYIPLPGQTMADAPAVDPAVANTPAPSASTVISGRLANRDIVAKVWPDGRLAVPRSALEAAVYLGGSPLHGGDPVYVSQTDTEAVILTADPNSTEFKAYEVWNSGGRVAFPSQTNTPFVHGNAYACKLEKGKITVDLSKTVTPKSSSITD